jgi:hypothetical protein
VIQNIYLIKIYNICLDTSAIGVYLMKYIGRITQCNVKLLMFLKFVNKRIYECVQCAP